MKEFTDWRAELRDCKNRVTYLVEDKHIYRKYKEELKDKFCFRVKEFTDWIVEVTDQEDKAEFCWSD